MPASPFEQLFDISPFPAVISRLHNTGQNCASQKRMIVVQEACEGFAAAVVLPDDVGGHALLAGRALEEEGEHIPESHAATIVSSSHATQHGRRPVCGTDAPRL